MSDLSRKRLVGEVWFWIAVVIGIVAVIGIGAWAFGVFTSDIKGAGGAIKQRNSTVNRVFAQQNFEQLNADIDGYIAKIALAKEAYKRSPTDINSTNLTGVQQVCVQATADYNADSRKYLLRDFKGAGLPATRSADECR